MTKKSQQEASCTMFANGNTAITSSSSQLSLGAGTPPLSRFDPFCSRVCIQVPNMSEVMGTEQSGKKDWQVHANPAFASERVFQLCSTPPPRLQSSSSVIFTPLGDGASHGYDGRYSRAHCLFGANIWRLHQWSAEGAVLAEGAHRGEGQGRDRAESPRASLRFGASITSGIEVSAHRSCSMALL